MQRACYTAALLTDLLTRCAQWLGRKLTDPQFYEPGGGFERLSRPYTRMIQHISITHPPQREAVLSLIDKVGDMKRDAHTRLYFCEALPFRMKKACCEAVQVCLRCCQMKDCKRLSLIEDMICRALSDDKITLVET